VAVLIILALAGTGLLNPADALAGFSSEPAIVVVSIFVLGGALHQTGALSAFTCRSRSPPRSGPRSRSSARRRSSLPPTSCGRRDAQASARFSDGAPRTAIVAVIVVLLTRLLWSG
jgi:hypothetical protein